MQILRKFLNRNKGILGHETPSCRKDNTFGIGWNKTKRENFGSPIRLSVIRWENLRAFTFGKSITTIDGEKLASDKAREQLILAYKGDFFWYTELDTWFGQFLNAKVFFFFF